MRVLVTGGAGFVGTNLIKRLLKDGHEVISVDNYSTGKKAKAISDRSGMAFPYKEMVKEWNGAFVHKSEFEQKHPQLLPKKFRGDAQGLQNALSVAKAGGDVISAAFGMPPKPDK